jgi:hypothetical protein
MIGRLKSEQGQLFYRFDLNDAVPEDHLVRMIDAALDRSWLRSELGATMRRRRSAGVQRQSRAASTGAVPSILRLPPRMTMIAMVPMPMIGIGPVAPLRPEGLRAAVRLPVAVPSCRSVGTVVRQALCEGRGRCA